MKISRNNNSWKDILIEVFEYNHEEVAFENNNTNVNVNVLLVEKEMDQLEIKWLKEREQYKLTDGLGNTFFPDNDFTYRMIVCVLQNLIGLLLFCTFMKSFFLIEILNMDDFSSLNPEVRSYLISTIVTFIAILISFILSVRMMIKGKRKFDQAKEKYLKQREELLSLRD